MSNTLLIRLEGALQSWGERGRWSVRDSAPEPTKSGVIGLVACTMGLSGDDELRHLSEQTVMGVRVDKAGTRLTDYHTIGGGYDVPMLLTAAGKPKKSSGRPHTEISHRDYLADASFLVALQSDDFTLIQRMADGLQNPVWIPFLGRKSCPPSTPLFVAMGQYNDLESALKHDYTKPASVIIETDPTQPKKRTAIRSRQNDHIVSRQYRIYHPRYVDKYHLALDVLEEENA